MKLLFVNIFLLLGLVLAMQSCKKAAVSDVFVSDTTNVLNDTVWIKNDSAISPIVASSLNEPVVVDSFNCTEDGTISFGDSISASFPKAGCMVSNTPGSTIKTPLKVRAEIVVLRTKGDLIRFGIPTVSNNALLEAGVYVNIRLRNNKKDVYWNSAVAPILIKIKASSPSQEMKYFSSPFATSSAFYYWVSNPMGGIGRNSVSPFKDSVLGSNAKKTGYIINTTQIGWFGCSTTLDNSPATQQTRLNVSLPLNFTNKNTVVYASFDNKKTVIRLASNPYGRSYYSPTTVPKNTKLTILTISKIGSEYYLGTNVTQVTSNVPISVVPEKKTLDFVINYLNKL
ncbi:hypothetical protein [Parasediminibacterium sp. JCM 36343]|uniref:hypothetical protein n=1 Tax=Parasediminibacterium sp. JCM 36343 TaxID=3374279 RepID=UPI00397A6C6A